VRALESRMGSAQLRERRSQIGRLILTRGVVSLRCFELSHCEFVLGFQRTELGPARGFLGHARRNACITSLDVTLQSGGQVLVTVNLSAQSASVVDLLLHGELETSIVAEALAKRRSGLVMNLLQMSVRLVQIGFLSLANSEVGGEARDCILQMEVVFAQDCASAVATMEFVSEGVHGRVDGGMRHAARLQLRSQGLHSPNQFRFVSGAVLNNAMSGLQTSSGHILIGQAGLDRSLGDLILVQQVGAFRLALSVRPLSLVKIGLRDAQDVLHVREVAVTRVSGEIKVLDLAVQASVKEGAVTMGRLQGNELLSAVLSAILTRGEL